MWGGGAATAMLAAALVAFLSIATLVSRGGDGELLGLNSQSSGSGSLEIQFPDLSPNTSQNTASGNDAPAGGPTLGLAPPATVPSESAVVAPDPVASAPTGSATPTEPPTPGANRNENDRDTNSRPGLGERAASSIEGGGSNRHQATPDDGSGRRIGQGMDPDTNGVPELPLPPDSDTPTPGGDPAPIAPPENPDPPTDPPGVDPSDPTDPVDPTPPAEPPPADPPTDPTPPPSDPSDPAPPVDPPPSDPTGDPANPTDPHSTTEPSDPTTPPDQTPPDETPQQSDPAGLAVGRGS